MRFTILSSCRFSIRRLLLLAFLCSSATASHAALHTPETPDPDPDLGLLRSDSAGGVTQGHVYAIAPHPRGGVIVGGEFIRMEDGSVRTHLLRLRGDGTLDPDFDVAITSQGSMRVNAIASSADAIYIGGRWQKIDGIERPCLAKLTLDGELIETWHPDGDNAIHSYDEIHAIALAGSAVFVGGSIETLRLMGLAKLDAATGTIDPDWRAQTQTVEHDGEPDLGWRGSIRSIVFTGTDLVVGGNFVQIARQSRRSVARISLTAPVTVSPYAIAGYGGSGVTSLAYDRRRQQVYVGGRFFADSGTYDNLVRTDATGVIDTSWTPNPENEVASIQLARSHVYYGGRFDDAEGPYLARTRIAGNGITDSTWLPLPDKDVKALLWQGGAERLWAGGEFVDMGAHTRNGLVRFSFAGKDLLFRDGLETDCCKMTAHPHDLRAANAPLPVATRR